MKNILRSIKSCINSISLSRLFRKALKVYIDNWRKQHKGLGDDEYCHICGRPYKYGVRQYYESTICVDCAIDNKRFMIYQELELRKGDKAYCKFNSSGDLTGITIYNT